MRMIGHGVLVCATAIDEAPSAVTLVRRTTRTRPPQRGGNGRGAMHALNCADARRYPLRAEPNRLSASGPRLCGADRLPHRARARRAVSAADGGHRYRPLP